MSNYQLVRGNIYLVRTQAGFRQALKDAGWEKDLNGEPLAWPVQYPSLVIVSTEYDGAFRYTPTCIHLNEVLSIIRGE